MSSRPAAQAPSDDMGFADVSQLSWSANLTYLTRAQPSPPYIHMILSAILGATLMSGNVQTDELEWLSCRFESGEESLVLALDGPSEGYSMQGDELIKLINIDLPNGVKVRSSVTPDLVRFEFSKADGVSWVDIVDRHTLKYTKLVTKEGKPYEGRGTCVRIPPRPYTRKF